MLTIGRVSAAGGGSGAGVGYRRLRRLGRLFSRLWRLLFRRRLLAQALKKVSERQTPTMKAEDHVRTSSLSTDMSFPPSQNIIQVQNLTKTIQNGAHRVEILRGLPSMSHAVSCRHHGSIRQRQKHASRFNGRSGQGTSGQVVLDGIELMGLAEDKLARVRGPKIGFVSVVPAGFHSHCRGKCPVAR